MQVSCRRRLSYCKKKTAIGLVKGRAVFFDDVFCLAVTALKLIVHAFILSAFDL